MQFRSLRANILLNLLLIISLAFNQGLTLLASSSTLSSMQSYANQDTLAICTGKTMKWIAADIYFDSGQIIEVDAPNSTPQDLQEVDCLFSQFIDSPNCQLSSINDVILDYTLNLDSDESITSQPITQFIDAKRARAPPLLFI